MQTTLTYSVNPQTGKKYQIPEVLEDRTGIDQFLQNHEGKKVVVVQGLGFVGAVMSIVCANALTEEYAVIGVDLPREDTFWKIKSINEGQFPISASDPKVQGYYEKAMEKGNFYASFDPYAYSKADVIIVDINLDVQKNSNFNKDLESYDVDLSGFEKAMKVIGEHCKEEVLVLVETTVPPGTCKKVVEPILKEALLQRELSLDHLKIGHSYERVMPGPNYIDSIQNFYRVFSGVDEKSAVATETFLRTIISTEKYPLTRLGNTNATEMAKVFENSYRAMNIAFAVEWSRFAEEAGVDLWEVIQAIRMRPTHSNLMFPNIGVGGYCLTKDPLLASWAKQTLFESDAPLGQSEKGVQINDKMPLYAFRFLQKEYGEELANKNVLLLGVSYRGDVGDTRYSPVEPFYEYLKKEGCNIDLCDPYVPYWEEQDVEIPADYQGLITNHLDIIAFTAGHSQYKENAALIEEIMALDKVMIYDTIGILTNDEIAKLNSKHTVRVVGRGDIK